MNSAHLRLPSLLLTLCALAVLAGCGPKTIALVPAPPDAAASAWNAFTDYSAEREAQSGPFRLQCGLRYSDAQGDGNRANAVLWGNNDDLVRLDVLAGMGALVGRVRQSGEALVIHSPREDKAWIYQGRGKALLSFGVPVPLALPDVAAILQGRYQAVFGPVHGANPYLADGGIGFRLEGGRLPGDVTLTPEGLLVRWQEAPGAWTMHVEYDNGTPPLPRLLEIDHPEGRRAVLTVTSRQAPAAFSETQLRLDLPPGTAVETMRQASR